MPEREASVSAGIRLEYWTVGWNALEAAAAIAASLYAGSIALMSFGLDSLIELASGGILLWRLRRDIDEARRERVELIAGRLVGVSFILLSVYIACDSAVALWHKQAPGESVSGIVIAAASLVVMPMLARAKRRVAHELGSGAMHADSKQTDVCAYLAAILLAGLVLNVALGWWWADPVAGLIMLPLILKEAREAWEGHLCCDE